MTGARLELAAPAKINLYLQVTGRRSDGYHTLATLMQKISLYDRVILRCETEGISVSCPDSDLPENKDNLVWRAAELFFERTAHFFARQPGVSITLHKTIPVAAGLGGGSSDAAAVLTGLNLLFGTGCPTGELIAMGRSLGADVPLFVIDWPLAWATGIGDVLSPAHPFTGYRIVLVNPGFAVSTPWVYRNFTLTADEKIFNLDDFRDEGNGSVSADQFGQRPIDPSEMRNDLEAVTADHFPEIDHLKARLLEAGAVTAMMSGSGPSVFGLFLDNEADKAEACCRELKSEYRNTFLVDPLPSGS